METDTSTTTTTAGPFELDLAFIIDATGSMGSYIHAAQTVCSRSSIIIQRF